MRLIDADELKEVIERELAGDGYGIKRFTEIIDNAPAVDTINMAINTIKDCCNENNVCIHCPMNHNCNEQPAKWEEV